jgi:hypothetical protein
MLITKFTATVLYSGASGVTLHMSQSTNIFNLSQITIDCSSGVNGFVGCWNNGCGPRTDLAHAASLTSST